MPLPQDLSTPLNAVILNFCIFLAFVVRGFAYLLMRLPFSIEAQRDFFISAPKIVTKQRSQLLFVKTHSSDDVRIQLAFRGYEKVQRQYVTLTENRGHIDFCSEYFANNERKTNRNVSYVSWVSTVEHGLARIECIWAYMYTRDRHKSLESATNRTFCCLLRRSEYRIKSLRRSFCRP